MFNGKELELLVEAHYPRDKQMLMTMMMTKTTTVTTKKITTESFPPALPPKPLYVCGHFLWTLFVDTFCGNFYGPFLWTVFVDSFGGNY